jgi:twitching motility protein PilT
MFDVMEALRELVAKNGSDLHLKVGSGPLFRVNGELAQAKGAPPLEAGDTIAALEQLLTDEAKREEFTTEREVDFSFEIPNLARFRINTFQQRGLVSMACRLIPHDRRAGAAAGGH